MQKNTAGQKWIVFAFDVTDGTMKTGDAAQITANVRKDGGAADPVADTNPTELESGYYAFDLEQEETNGDSVVICPVSSTADIQVVGVPGAVYTLPAGQQMPLPTATQTSIDNTEIAVGNLNDPTAAAVADAVWQEALADHVRSDGTTRVAEIINALILNNYAWNDTTNVFTIYADDGASVLKTFTVSSTGRV